MEYVQTQLPALRRQQGALVDLQKEKYFTSLQKGTDGEYNQRLQITNAHQSDSTIPFQGVKMHHTAIHLTEVNLSRVFRLLV